MSKFKEEYPKSHRPEITDLDQFFDKEISYFFREFSNVILDKYDLRFGIPTWSEKNGWMYRIGKSGVYLITGINIEKDRFTIDTISVTNTDTYHLLLDYIQSVYKKENKNFLDKIAEKNKRQAERNKIRVQREKDENIMQQDKVMKDRYNKFRWPDKLNINKLKQLYLLDSKGIQDEVLADEIGLTLYLRCKNGKEDMELLERYMIRCHNCNSVIEGHDDFRECKCGYQYSYREYRRNYRKNNMPSGAAAKVFDEYIQNWIRAQGYNSKMILIDKLLHEFHLSLVSGAIHRPVAMNFIDGTREKVTNIINELAYN
ncbi:MAG: hypothetical protein KIC94_07255 [Clostridiales bacterium]|nr:hypothetical protein [Clostridiales bacterium]